jgi:SAM-dependent methyltransferase
VLGRRIAAARARIGRVLRFVQAAHRMDRFATLEVRNYRLEIHRRRPVSETLEDRIVYQSRFVDFGIQPGDRVLDVGSGGDPFPYATHLVDLYLEPSRHRHSELNTAGKPFTVADLQDLPFADGSFDFVYCSHLLEHVDDPIQACRELMRVARRGYIETPTMMKDVLFCWANEMHRWHVVASGNVLCFFEYTDRQLEGVRSSVWHDIAMGQWANPLQDVFRVNQDIFNVLFLWKETFGVIVFRLDGAIESYNAEVIRRTDSCVRHDPDAES